MKKYIYIYIYIYNYILSGSKDHFSLAFYLSLNDTQNPSSWDFAVHCSTTTYLISSQWELLVKWKFSIHSISSYNALTAPIMIRKMSHLYPQMTTRGVGVWIGTWCILTTGQRNIARKPVSRSWDSHPKMESSHFNVL